MIEGIKYTRDYGKINLRLRELMDQQGIKRNQIAQKIDVRFEVVDKWYNGDLERLDLDILARLCFALHCQAGDLLVYEEAAAENTEGTVQG